VCGPATETSLSTRWCRIATTAVFCGFPLRPPRRLPPVFSAKRKDIAHRILTELDYAGVLAIEFFEHQGGLVANEMAPRVHNSGHWTIEGAVTSQFENHLRAILDLPLVPRKSTDSRPC